METTGIVGITQGLLPWPDDFLWCWKFSRKHGTFGCAAKKEDQLIRATPTRPGEGVAARIAPIACGNHGRRNILIGSVFSNATATMRVQ